MVSPERKLLRARVHTGRPLGEEALLATLEQDLGRILRRQKPGRKERPRSLVWCPRNQCGVPGNQRPRPQ